jgi:hypothetical protein
MYHRCSQIVHMRLGLPEIDGPARLHILVLVGSVAIYATAQETSFGK